MYELFFWCCGIGMKKRQLFKCVILFSGLFVASLSGQAAPQILTEDFETVQSRGFYAELLEHSRTPPSKNNRH